jgi:hypothetical protein
VTEATDAENGAKVAGFGPHLFSALKVVRPAENACCFLEDQLVGDEPGRSSEHHLRRCAITRGVDVMLITTEIELPSRHNPNAERSAPIACPH